MNFLTNYNLSEKNKNQISVKNIINYNRRGDNMSYTSEEIKQGIKLHCIETKKFKTVSVKINFKRKVVDFVNI